MLDDGDWGDFVPSPAKPAPVRPAVAGGRGASGSSSRAESSGSGAGRAASKTRTPAVSTRILSNAALPSRRSDVRPGVIPLIAPTLAPTAEVASQMLRRTVVHGSIEWTQGLTLEQMLQQKWLSLKPSLAMTALGSDGQGPNGLLSFFWIFSILFDFV